MFKFFKELFKKEVEKAEVNISDISKWFSDKTKHVFEELNISLESDFNEIKEVLGSLRENLATLNNAEMKDSDKIQDKIRQIVVGHRESYCRVLSHFINNIEFPKEINYVDGKRAAFDIDEGLTQVGKTTGKSYQAVQHLFSDELKNVANDLKKISNLSKQIKEKTEKSKVGEIDKIKEDIDGLIESIKKRKDLKEQLKEKRELLQGFENKKKEYEDKIEGLKESGDYKRLAEYNKRLGEIEDSIKNREHEVIELFSTIETGLKKFERVTLENEKLVREYIASSVKALFNDKELKIVQLLENMERSIKSGSVDLRDKKRDKVLKGIENIFPQKLKTIISEHDELEEKKEDVKRNISSNPVKSQIKDIEYNIEHNSFKLKKQKEDIDLAEKKYNQIDLDVIKKELEEKIKERIDVEVIISF
ncbi:MAG: hypothetical protein V3V78_04775 [Candidatus Woesearchaeota archaeon]